MVLLQGPRGYARGRDVLRLGQKRRDAMQEALELGRGVIHPWHLDHFGHMNVRHYAPFFDDAVYHIWARMGLGYAMMQEVHGLHMVTAEARTSFVKELRAGDLVVITGAVARIGTKSCTLAFSMRHAESGAEHARYEVVEVMFDPATRRAAPMPGAIRARLAQWVQA
jgi:acyl-CoA thioester hydrolase